MNRDFYRIHSEVCKVFSNPTRLELLDLLRGKGMSVSRLMEKAGLGQANVSQHLSIMKSKGIVADERRGKNVHYRIRNPQVVRAFDIMRKALAENLKKRL